MKASTRILVVLALLAVASLACSTTIGGMTFGATVTPTITNTPLPTSTPTSTPLPTATSTPELIQGIDYPISFDGINMTVTDAYFAATFDVGNNQYLSPNEGYTILVVAFDYTGTDPWELLEPDGSWILDAYVKTRGNVRFIWEQVTWIGPPHTMLMAFAPTVGSMGFTLYLHGVNVPLDRFFTTNTSGISGN